MIVGGKDTRGGAGERDVPRGLSRLFHYHTSQVSLFVQYDEQIILWLDNDDHNIKRQGYIDVKG